MSGWVAGDPVVIKLNLSPDGSWRRTTSVRGVVVAGTPDKVLVRMPDAAGASRTTWIPLDGKKARVSKAPK